MAQPQGVDREPPARLGREKRRDGLGRGRQRGLRVHGAPLGESRHPRAVGAPGIVGAGGAAVIGGGGLGLGEARGRRRQARRWFRARTSRAPRPDPPPRAAAPRGRRRRRRGNIAIAVASTNSPPAIIGSPSPGTVAASSSPDAPRYRARFVAGYPRGSVSGIVAARALTG